MPDAWNFNCLPGFQEKAAVIAEYLRLDQNDVDDGVFCETSWPVFVAQNTKADIRR